MTLALQLRAAQPGEAAELTALALRSKAHWGYSAAFMAACVPELTVLPSDLEAPQRKYVVALQAGQCCGFYALEPRSAEAWELEALFVEPECIGQGVGRALLQHAQAWLRAQGVSQLLIQSDPFAEAFYLAMGAVVSGRQPSASIPGRWLTTFVLAL